MYPRFTFDYLKHIDTPKTSVRKNISKDYVEKTWKQ